MSCLNELKASIKAELPKLDVVIGWEQGFDAVHTAPLFMKTEEDVDKLVIGPLSVHNLATYLPGLRGKKVGVVLKGCDSRAVIQLLQENLINRDDLTLFGYGCDGIISLKRLSDKVGELGFVKSIEFENGSAKVTIAGNFEDYEEKIERTEVCPEKCLTCRYPNAIECDNFAGERSGYIGPEEKSPSLVAFEEMTLDQRFIFWQDQMRRCVRCYACRNACPMCVCRDHCIATSREPHWVSQETNVAENFMFQIIHTMHLSGRCVECGECERACPMDIPIMLLRRKMAGIVGDVFSYAAGTQSDATPPLLTFKVEEETINERGW